MAIYLVKEDENGKWRRFSEQEIGALRIIMSRAQFEQISDRDYRGPNREYVGIRTRFDAIQLQGISDSLLRKIQEATNPGFFTTDGLYMQGDLKLRPIGELPRNDFIRFQFVP